MLLLLSGKVASDGRVNATSQDQRKATASLFKHRVVISYAATHTAASSGIHDLLLEQGGAKPWAWQ